MITLRVRYPFIRAQESLSNDEQAFSRTSGYARSSHLMYVFIYRTYHTDRFMAVYNSSTGWNWTSARSTHLWRAIHSNNDEVIYFICLSDRALIIYLGAWESAMLNSFSRIGEARPKQEWSNGTEFCGMLGLKFRKCLFHLLLHTEFPEYLVEWKAP